VSNVYPSRVDIDSKLTTVGSCALYNIWQPLVFLIPTFVPFSGKTLRPNCEDFKLDGVGKNEEKIADFRPVSGYIITYRKREKIGIQLQWKTNRNSHNYGFTIGTNFDDLE